MDFRKFIESQLDKGNLSWESRSEFIRASGSLKAVIQQEFSKSMKVNFSSDQKQKLKIKK